ncbi:MAG: DUF1552 domain-containing protein [Verrucomicrobiae bacterium]|nr:DUF1552 domain-containing protein [Verrucomicrobiae bacterium]
MNTRRHFLRSSSALIALPFLESLGFRRFASAAPAAVRPKRMVFLGFGWGVTKESWYPDRKQTGAGWTLPPGLAPLKRHQQDLTVIQNLNNQFSNDAHWGSTFWLTGANRFAEPGQSFHNSISADQIAAERFGKDTRFTSLQLSCENGEESGHGPGLSLAWNRQGKPVSGFNNPVTAFHRLFSEESVPLEQRQALLKQKRSVLDTVLDDAGSVARGLSKEDTDKLGEYLQSIRDIETRLAKEEQWLDKPKPQPAGLSGEPKEGIAGYEEIQLMYDLIVAALQTDSTRVVTYRQPVDRLIQGLGITFTGHNMSHYTPGPRMDASQLRDQKQSELLAHLLDKLKATQEPDGTSLFDHVTLAYGSNIQSIHYLENCPTVITGRGAGVKLGQHLVLPDPKTPLCNLWLTLLKGSGLPVESHGDSFGVIRELIG